MGTVIAAVVAAITSVLVTGLSLVLAGRQRQQAEERARRREIDAGFLSPLRLQAALVHIRLVDVLERVAGDGTRRQALAVIGDPREVAAQSTSWFAGEGCYLTSTAYLTACLFACATRVSRNHPFMRMVHHADTKMTGLLANVQRAFLKDFGIYSVLQPSVGEAMWLIEAGRLRTYREFCSLLTDPDSFVWLERIFLYYLEAGRGEKLERVRDAVKATEELARFLDQCLGGSGKVIAQLAVDVVIAYP